MRMAMRRHPPSPPAKEGLAQRPGAPGRHPIPPCKGGADAVPWGAREASPIPSCKGGAGGAPWGTREASAIPFCEGGAGAVPASGIIFLLIYCDDVDKNTSKNVLFSKRGERCKINKKRRSSPHVEIDSICGDDRQFYE